MCIAQDYYAKCAAKKVELPVQVDALLVAKRPPAGLGVVVQQEQKRDQRDNARSSSVSLSNRTTPNPIRFTGHYSRCTSKNQDKEGNDSTTAELLSSHKNRKTTASTKKILGPAPATSNAATTEEEESQMGVAFLENATRGVLATLQRIIIIRQKQQQQQQQQPDPKPTLPPPGRHVTTATTTSHYSLSPRVHHHRRHGNDYKYPSFDHQRQQREHNHQMPKNEPTTPTTVPVGLAISPTGTTASPFSSSLETPTCSPCLLFNHSPPRTPRPRRCVIVSLEDANIPESILFPF